MVKYQQINNTVSILVGFIDILEYYDDYSHTHIFKIV